MARNNFLVCIKYFMCFNIKMILSIFFILSIRFLYTDSDLIKIFEELCRKICAHRSRYIVMMYPLYRKSYIFHENVSPTFSVILL